jgi:hypothetical protein
MYNKNFGGACTDLELRQERKYKLKQTNVGPDVTDKMQLCTIVKF